ncbi:creatininase family protein [Alterisphingorhabdus coralli]|uniref:Creatininase family protein n=1 Tax=Alterisphingorhabdus coralli TaxID=3071408 RepID=A0AA97F5B4_9SPHN|nr:creatininase family protein [Parasphingorhabdus sp. SCSIO 66989]WOE74293.1 creatininase family protein [Parasphingorhabdus sp. SCSIO 66989]
MFVESIFADATAHLNGIVDPQSRIWALYLIGSLMLAFVGYGHLKRSGHLAKPGQDHPGFLRYVFDRDIWLHASTRQDLFYFLANGLIYYGLISQFLIGSYGLSMVFYNGLVSTFGALDQPVISSGWSVLVYSLAFLMAVDFGAFITHWAQHKIPLLWQFHQVHHSAERLTPLTLFRMHPINLAFAAFVVTLLSAIAYAGVFYLSGQAPRALMVLGVNVFLFAFNLLGYNLRHSQIWLDYPAWLSRLFVSPAQHQIHHSSDPKHFDRNLGLVFSIWDQLFGTYYRAKSYERLSFGLSRTEPNPFKTVAALYWQPFADAARLIVRFFDTGRRKVIFALIMFIAVVSYGQLFMNSNHAALAASNQTALPSLRLADLTWTEVQSAIDQGYDTVLVPTAGIEQNGPHVVLGKHHIVIGHNSVQIADQLGRTLVLPVIDYVPEGDVGDMPSGHMQFAGTISVPEPVFEEILEAAARSMRTHGFKNIFFIGDSGGNQQAQARVAERLQAEWKAEDMLVAHIGDYYIANGQFDALLSQGYTSEQIGTHAGIRDTSEVLFLEAQAVRRQPLLAPKNRPNGVIGDPSLASAEIGEKMTKLKVDAAVRQIKQLDSFSFRLKHILSF